MTARSPATGRPPRPPSSPVGAHPGVGSGHRDGRDALEFLVAGCSAVQVGTATFVDGSAIATVHTASPPTSTGRGLRLPGGPATVPTERLTSGLELWRVGAALSATEHLGGDELDQIRLCGAGHRPLTVHGAHTPSGASGAHRQAGRHGTAARRNARQLTGSTALTVVGQQTATPTGTSSWQLQTGGARPGSWSWSTSTAFARSAPRTSSRLARRRPPRPGAGEGRLIAVATNTAWWPAAAPLSTATCGDHHRTVQVAGGTASSRGRGRAGVRRPGRRQPPRCSLRCSTGWPEGLSRGEASLAPHKEGRSSLRSEGTG